MLDWSRIGFFPIQAGFDQNLLSLGCIPAEEMQLVMKHVPGCSAEDVDEMIEAIDRQDDNAGCVQKPITESVH